MENFTYQELAEYCVNKFPCNVEVSINPNMYLGGRSKGKGKVCYTICILVSRA